MWYRGVTMVRSLEAGRPTSESNHSLILGTLAAVHAMDWGGQGQGPQPGRSSTVDRLEGAWLSWMPVCPGSVSRSARSVWTQCSVCPGGLGSRGSSFLWWTIVDPAFWGLACSALQMMAVRSLGLWWPVVAAARGSPLWRTTLMGHWSEGVRWAEVTCLGGKSSLPQSDGHRSPGFGRWSTRCLMRGHVMGLSVGEWDSRASLRMAMWGPEPNVALVLCVSPCSGKECPSSLHFGPTGKRYW